MTELTVIRHGETDWNRQHRFQGQIDVPLNATGLAQAARLAGRLAGESFDVLLASDLQRAKATADAVAQPRRQPVLLQPLWREQAFGVLEGLDVTTIRHQHRVLWDQWVRHEADYALPGGGESNRHFFERVMQAVAETVRAHAGARIAVVTHGGVLDMLWRAANALPLHGPRACAIPNTGINRLRIVQGQITIVQWADDTHLQGLPDQPSTVPASN